MPPSMSRVGSAWRDGDHLLVLCLPETPLDDMDFRTIDLDTGQVATLLSAIIARHQALSCRLADGRILLAAGVSSGIGGSDAPVEFLTRACEVYDPAEGGWKPVGTLAVPHLSTDRSGQSLVALPDGDALMVSGSNPGVPHYTDVVERWSSTTGAVEAPGTSDRAAGRARPPCCRTAPYSSSAVRALTGRDRTATPTTPAPTRGAAPTL